MNAKKVTITAQSMLIVKIHMEDSTASVTLDMREMECNVKVSYDSNHRLRLMIWKSLLSF